MLNKKNYIKSKNLREIIINKNICIRNNPEGIDKLWPKSYIDNFYENLFRKKKLKGKLRILIEINNKNNNSILLWQSYFSKLDIFKFKFIDNNLFIDKNYSSEFLCDIVIINNGNKVKNIRKLIDDSLSYLNMEGYLVIEDIGLKSKEMLMSFITIPLNYELRLFDYRAKRLIANNSILSIKRSKNHLVLNFFYRLFMSFNLIPFTLLNIMVSYYPRISNFLKRIN